MIVDTKKYKCDFLNVLDSFKMEYSTFGIKNGVEALLIEFGRTGFRSTINRRWGLHCTQGTYLAQIMLFGVQWDSSRDETYFYELNEFLEKDLASKVVIPIELVTDYICDDFPMYVKNNLIDSIVYE